MQVPPLPLFFTFQNSEPRDLRFFERLSKTLQLFFRFFVYTIVFVAFFPPLPYERRLVPTGRISLALVHFGSPFL